MPPFTDPVRATLRDHAPEKQRSPAGPPSSRLALRVSSQIVPPYYSFRLEGAASARSASRPAREWPSHRYPVGTPPGDRSTRRRDRSRERRAIPLGAGGSAGGADRLGGVWQHQDTRAGSLRAALRRSALGRAPGRWRAPYSATRNATGVTQRVAAFS